MEINENICVCEMCKLPSDFGAEVVNELKETGGYIVYQYGEYFADDNNYVCNTCIEDNEKTYNEWFWGETA